MALMDLFRPKWMHSDSRVRRAAVERLTEQAILDAIARSDESWELRQAAVEKLSRLGTLEHIAENDRHAKVRMAALRRLSDQTILAEIAKTDSDADVRQAASEHLAAVLRDVAMSPSSRVSWIAREAAINKLSDQAILAEVVEYYEVGGQGARDDYKGISWRLLDAARKRMAEMRVAVVADQAALAEIAKTDSERDGCAALERITDQSVLADVARNARTLKVQAAAVERITNQTLLADIAGQARNSDTRANAAAKLSDQETLIAIAMTDPEPVVRAKAVRRLANVDVITELATTDHAAWVRQEAVMRVTDQALLTEIARNQEEEPRVRSAAIARLFDEALLAAIAESDSCVVTTKHYERDYDGYYVETEFPLRAAAKKRLAELRR